MCLEGRIAALLVALSPFGICGGGSVLPGITPAPAYSLQNAGTRTSPPGASPAAAGARIRGRLATPGGRRLLSGTLVITPEDSESAASVNATVLPDGSFVFSDVPPGSYLIRALAQTGPNDTPLFALLRVTVRDADLDTMTVVLRPGATISGRLVADSGGDSVSDVLAAARVRAPFSEGGSFGDAQTGAPRRDGTFVIRGVMAGAHLLAVDGLPAPWSVESVTYRGQDITDTGLQADSGQQFVDVKVTLTDKGSDVSGTVRDVGERVVANARVMFVPVPAQLWPAASRRFARSLTDGTGHYSVRGLPSGNYRVAAALDLDERDVYRAEVLRAVREEGVAIIVGARGNQVVDVSLTRISLQPQVTAR